MTKPSVTFWSVGTADEADKLGTCISSFRASGNYEPFVAITDTEIDGALCVAAPSEERTPLYNLACAEILSQSFESEYFVFIDPTARIRGRLSGIFATLEGGPVHVPLLRDISQNADQQGSVDGISIAEYAALLKAAGKFGPIYVGNPIFWIAHRETISSLGRTAAHLCVTAGRLGLTVSYRAPIDFAAQLFYTCHESHLAEKHPEIWTNVENERSTSAIFS